MPETKDISRAAGEQFGSAVAVSLEDAQQQRLRYHLLRLTLVGLTRPEVEDLGELARLAFQDSPVSDQASKIKGRADVSPLAFAIADVVERAERGLPAPVGLRWVLLGAVLGAYASLGDVLDRDETAAVLGAIGGAVALVTNGVIVDNMDRQASVEYLRMDE